VDNAEKLEMNSVLRKIEVDSADKIKVDSADEIEMDSADKIEMEVALGWHAPAEGFNAGLGNCLMGGLGRVMAGLYRGNAGASGYIIRGGGGMGGPVTNSCITPHAHTLLSFLHL
jgi:hypothetical protein